MCDAQNEVLFERILSQQLAMVSFALKQDIDYTKWDAVVLRDPSGLPYAESWVLDSICDNWLGLILNDYEAVCPLPIKKKYGLEYAYQPYPAQQLGIFSSRKLEQAEIEQLIQGIPKNIRFIDMFMKQDAFPDQLISDERINLLLDLNHNYDQLHSRYKERHKRNLQSSVNSNLDYLIDIPITQLLGLGKQNLDLSFLDESAYARLKVLMEKAIEIRRGFSVGAINGDGKLIGGVFMLKSERRLIYLFSVSNEEGRKKRAMVGLVDHLIKTYANQAMVLDFEGSMVSGIKDFFLGFGSDEENYLHIRQNRLPQFLKWLKG